jgi:[acyl-carrier-protein] S-malonyltransferase
VRAVCAKEQDDSGEVVEAVNFNAPGQVVVAGHATAVNRAAASLKEAGARRVMPLPVSAPFHSSLMAPAREGLEPTLRSLSFGDLSAPLYRNIDATPVTSGGDVREGLVRQVDRPVLWSAIIRNLIGEGFDTFVEVGAGSVLSGLVKRIDRSVTSYSAGTVDGVEAAVAALAGEGGNDA